MKQLSLLKLLAERTQVSLLTVSLAPFTDKVIFMNQKKTTKTSPTKKPTRSNRVSKAIREYTAGGLVYRTVGGKKEFLLIKDLKERWSIPKGHVESGETLEQTAIREIGEETGLKSLEIIDKLDKIHFFYRMEGKLIFMTTFVFLIEATDISEVVIAENSEGIIDVKWFSDIEAHDLIEYKDTKTLLEMALRKIEKLSE